VAHLTRRDGLNLPKIAPQAGGKTKTTSVPLRKANDVIAMLREGKLRGTKVLQP
jgi:hypothetical protein